MVALPAVSARTERRVWLGGTLAVSVPSFVGASLRVGVWIR